MSAPQPRVTLTGASLAYGQRTLWHDVDLTVSAGEFLAVLGPNGAGKTSLLSVLLGLTPLSAGSVTVNGHAPARGASHVGYIPQQSAVESDLPVRGRDLVRMGLDGHRFAGRGAGRSGRARVDAALAAVGAARYADAPVALLSGGEQQRLRVAQALVADPAVLLCDEPLLSLDLANQRTVTALIDAHRRRAGAAVLFVTHEINPVLPLVDRVLYLVAGRWSIGTPDEVFTTESLSALYGAPVDVLRVRDRIVVVGAPDTGHSGDGHDHPEEPAAAGGRRHRGGGSG